MTTLQETKPATRQGIISISAGVDLARDTPCVRRQGGPISARDERHHDDVVLLARLGPITGQPDACLFRCAPLGAGTWAGSLGQLVVLDRGSLGIEPHRMPAVVSRWSRVVRGRVRELRELRGRERREQV